MPRNPCPAGVPVFAAVAAFPIAALCAPALPATAHPAVTTAPAASAPAYRSPFDGRRGHADQPLQDWRESNALVGRVGGWKAYLREAQGAPSPGTRPPHVHGGHGHPDTAQPPRREAP